jgi:hypothetical protein
MSNNNIISDNTRAHITDVQCCSCLLVKIYMAIGRIDDSTYNNTDNNNKHNKFKSYNKWHNKVHIMGTTTMLLFLLLRSCHLNHCTDILLLLLQLLLIQQHSWKKALTSCTFEVNGSPKYKCGIIIITVIKIILVIRIITITMVKLVKCSVWSKSLKSWMIDWQKHVIMTMKSEMCGLWWYNSGVLMMVVMMMRSESAALKWSHYIGINRFTIND